MSIERDELSSRFQGVRRDPDVVGWNRGTGSTERAGDATEAIGSRTCYLRQLDPRLAQEVIERRGIAIVTISVSEAKE
jgi:hypothetical protein